MLIGAKAAFLAALGFAVNTSQIVSYEIVFL
jgi:hypothetical protein